MPDFTHDLTPIWSPATAALIAAAWTTHRDQTDREPIRQAYRDTQHQGLRGVLVGIMRGDDGA
ncbi:hypothetical protein UFOVP5_47 [uncultured Caudovirales phage]|uniref:Uncharacterized protein n=1 Tax=uncultured Caudovirales phage TaxID=2100421 RepID=A0A6J5KK89_9CAUD|nr:hypothetical protein UFOVP5_47 [uncultured Caudovirales phage]